MLFESRAKAVGSGEGQDERAYVSMRAAVILMDRVMFWDGRRVLCKDDLLAPTKSLHRIHVL